MSEDHGTRDGAGTREGAYCMRCRTQRPLQGARRTVLRNGRPAIKGSCPACGAPLFRIGGWIQRHR